MSVPPPIESPKPPGVGVASSAVENTGVHPATRQYTRDTALWSTVKGFGALVVAIAIGAVLGWREIMTEARAEGAKGAAALEPRVTATEQLRVEVYDMRKEQRAFYESQRTGVPLVLPPLPPPPPAPGGPKDAGP